MYCPINFADFATGGQALLWPLDLVTTLAVALAIAGALFLALWQVARHHGLSPEGSVPNQA
ncbi:MAG: hypothetical protein QF719_08475 [Chloroflexota bacterium]|jgi:hypothetical protein|nr:hypothetical protein [Chloroflexota bacterium]MDP6509232.1 hypothetical protein [Chloroflexota bacterium]MDP6758229.1 hypothetical protein [Chloroflexota bacterium]